MQCFCQTSLIIVHNPLWCCTGVKLEEVCVCPNSSEFNCIWVYVLPKAHCNLQFFNFCLGLLSLLSYGYYVTRSMYPNVEMTKSKLFVILQNSGLFKCFLYLALFWVFMVLLSDMKYVSFNFMMSTSVYSKVILKYPADIVLCKEYLDQYRQEKRH